MNHVRLDQLFTRCDTKGTGFIDRDEFRELCGGFDIGAQDADIIFADLDHDGDGRISYEDFSHGFRDFLTPGSRRGTAQLTAPWHRQNSFRGTPENTDQSLVELEAKQKEMVKRHQRARKAWHHLADHLSQDDIKKFLADR